MTAPNASKYLADYYGIPDSEHWTVIFNVLFDHEDDSMIIPALPGNVEDIARKTGIPEERVSEELGRLVSKGALFISPSGDFVIPRVLLELRDASSLGPGIPPEFWQAWEKIKVEDYSTALQKQRETGYKSRSRTIPINETAPAENQVLDHNSLRKIIKDAKLVVTVPCPCRRQAEIAGTRPADCPAGDKSFCILTGGLAQLCVDRGVGTVMSTGEALQRIDDAAAAGLVHNVTDFVDNYEVAREIGMSICNCCPCCCILMYSVFKGFPEILHKSGFQPVFTGEDCSGCGECESSCPFDAISMADVAQIDLEKCRGCGNCVLVCPVDALIMEPVM